MDDCLDIGKTLTDKLLDKAIEKSRNIFCFNSIAKEVEQEKCKLEDMMELIKVATEKNKSIRTKSWEQRAHELIQRITEAKKHTEAKQRCFFVFCPDCIWRYKMGEILTKLIKKINELIEEGWRLENFELPFKELIEKGEKLENVELARVLPDIERYSSQYYISFKSRELIYKKLLNALKDDSNYITGLHGMGGIGKTTLAKEVGKQLKTSKRFEHVIDTTVSFAPDIKKIQDDIAGSLGLEWRDVNESDRPKKLWSRLTNGEKILVILDDVWGNLNFDDIGLPNSDNHKGCKVLVTTRNMSVCNKMACGATIRVELLSEEDAWIMFKMHANLNNISTKSFLDKGRKIAIECKRLPVAIATIASSLKGQKRREEWDVALKSLQKHVSMDDVDDDLVDIYRCWKFSYDYLKDEKAKGLFLLCSLFQEDEEIPVEILTRLGIGVGLFAEDYDCYDDVRSQAAVAKNKLLDSCLLLETDKGDVKMHDLVRDVAQWIANKEIQTVNFSNKNQKSLVERDKNIKYLLYEGNLEDLVSSRFNGSKLEILIVKMDMGDSVNVHTSFFENMVGLRVLKFSYETKSSTYFFNEDLKTSLPQSIQSLTNIRSLLVEGVNLGDISCLGSLQSLETIDLDHCEIDELPREIEKLKKLRLLNLETCEIRSNNPYEVIQRCTSLEELYLCNSFNNVCREITLPALKRYRLSDGFSMMNDSLLKCVSFKQDYFSEGTLKYVIQGIELLRLERINKGWRNLMPEIVPIDHGMNDLIELHLKYDSQLQYLIYIEHIDSQVPKVFSNLVVLYLEEMKNLEELCNGPIPFDSLNNLEEVTIKCCQHLRSLFKCSLNLCNLKNMTLKSCSTLVSVFDLSTSRRLLLLESLEIIDCNKLENIITYDTIEETVDGDSDNQSCNSMFPKLKKVNIQRCHQLQFVLPFHSARDLLLLEVIIINCCHKLKYIFGQHQDVKLASLQEIVIGDLPNFIDIFPLESIPYSLTIRERAQCLSRSISMSQIMCNITLMNVSKIKSVLMLSIASKVSWESLTIKNCDELEHIIAGVGDNSGRGDVFPKLKELNVENCVKLKYIVGQIKASDDHQNHNEVTHILFPVLECLKLCSLPRFIDMCTESYHTTFPSLKKFVGSVGNSTTFKENGDGQISIPSFSISKDVDLGDSEETTQTSNQESKGHHNGNENPSLETTKDFDVGIKVEAASGHEMSSSQVNDEVSRNDDAFKKVSSNIEESKPSLSTTSPIDAEIKVQAALGHELIISNDEVSRNDDAFKKVSSNIEESKPSPSTTSPNDAEIKVQAALGHELILSNDEVSRNDDAFKKVSSNIEESKPSPSTTSPIDVEIKVQAALGHELILSQESMDEQCMMNQQDSVGEINTTIKPSQGDKEVGDGKICIPSFSIVNTKPTPTKDVDIGDSQKTIAMEDITKLIEEDPLLALEKLLIGQVSISSIRILLQELKSLMDSSSDLDHLISNQESKSKLISLFNQLNQHQGLLPSHMKEFIGKVQTFFNDNIIKYATFQQVLKKHNQLLDSKTDLVNKLWSAYSTQTHIDNEISTANARIDELSLQIDEHTKKLEDIENQREDLKSVMNRCNVQKNKLKAECTEWAQQSKQLLSALASSEVDVREAERARNLATEGFANLKSSFPTF